MKFILIQKQPLTNQNVKVTTKAFFDNEFNDVLETVDIDTLRETIKYPPQSISIEVRGHYLTEILIKTITPAYLRGSKITVNGVEFPTCQRNPQYFYQWQEKIPSTLPEHLKEAYKNFKLRGSLYQELVEWNQSRIAKATEASKFKWALAEDFYKQLYKSLTPQHIKVQSPNKKTFYEATAELDIENILKPQASLTDEEQFFLTEASVKNYIRAFGLQDTSVVIGTHHRTTPHGTTDEPILVSSQDIEASITASSFRRKDDRELEGYIDDNGFEVKQWNSSSSTVVDCPSKHRENIETLKWFLSQSKEVQEEFLMPGWHFCPVCGKLYHENEGCYDGDVCHIPEVEFVPYNENHGDEEDYDYEM